MHRYYHPMISTVPTLKGFQMPDSQKLRDEKIRRLMAVLRSQYGGDLMQLYAAKAHQSHSLKDVDELKWTTVAAAMQKRGMSDAQWSE